MHKLPHPCRFPCLDEMRFLAAAAILLMHTEQLKFLHGFGNGYKAIANWSIAVTFFFVLSGFLITYLLLAERDACGTIRLRQFYIRRGLRIVPLYFLVVFTGLVVIPYISGLSIPGLSEFVFVDWSVKLALFVAFLPNLAFVLFMPVPYVAQTWSIGTEEQFYFTWPLLLKFTRRHLVGMVAVVILAASARIIAEHVMNNPILTGFFTVAQIGSMAIGGIMAYLLFHHKRTALAFLFHPATQISSAALLGWIIATHVSIPFIHYEVHAVLFGCLIVNAAGNSAALLRPRSEWLAGLGKVSYGIYMYHPLAIGLSIWLLGSHLGLNLGRVGPTLLLYGLAVTITLGLSLLSYRYFETPFLKLKDRFAAKGHAAEVDHQTPQIPKAA